MCNEVLRSMSDNGEVSLLVVRGTELVQEACRRHQTAPTASAALGRALLGTLLMGCFKAEGETTQVTFRGDGIINGIQVIANATGRVKGKVGNPLADPPLRGDGKLDVGRAVGKGVLAVVRSHPLAERPYTGMVPIETGEVAEDLARYLVDSEQTNSALGLGVSIQRDASIRAAGGFLIQVLPFASDETVGQLEANLRGLPSMTQLLHDGNSPADITAKILAGIGVADSAFSLMPEFGPCEAEDLKERMKRAVALLGEAEVKQILEEQGKIEVTCEFCKDTYQFQEEEVLKVLEASRS
ncbi:hypothetical protein WJX72_002817 [[Myrmecia] bisecta]|uniref:33 kDa chaperonin n=1 Tax=[Myrmecia] bisecta TaxID=41462 RepID=A0AAW1P390_9CHLO